jgi:hypothetical protein
MEGDGQLTKTIKLKSCKLTRKDLIELEKVIKKRILKYYGKNTKIQWKIEATYGRWEIEEESLEKLLKDPICPPKFNECKIKAISDNIYIELLFTPKKANCTIKGNQTSIDKIGEKIELFIEPRKTKNFIYYTPVFFLIFGMCIGYIADYIFDFLPLITGIALIMGLGMLVVILFHNFTIVVFPYSNLIIKKKKHGIFWEKIIYPTIVSIILMIFGIIIGKIL